MTFKVTFETEVGSYDARLSRADAIEWLTSRRWAGMTEPITGAVTETADLDDERLSQALARATFDLLDEIAAKGGSS